ncbi:glycosyltransferase family 1 protein [Sphingomonas sp. BIUV-7]|uniref:Glycosyltransferase family 1 protein n=1 Tax=Sphingomonas natans TaxID=3063330 RepID=A0ABT8YCU4_9SPHN|nr:glycosyltransferase family 1 protein [Sphingomonas sp. BIUV-7]MDO6416163.1 glycosyltransferase family 1 protein [Sphingomonas sp. BIUV-7]
MSPPPRAIAFNGKFYSGGLNGVHRVADRLIREVDRQVSDLPVSERPPMRLLLPRKRSWTPTLQATLLDEQRLGHTQIWEQGILPGEAKHDVLVNLCNLAPLRHHRQLLLLHDAQYRFRDCSYPFRERWGHRLLAPRMAGRSARVLTVSQYSRQILDLTGVVERHRIAILHNGADHILDLEPNRDVFEEMGVTANEYVVLFGSTKRYKNVELLFDAFKRPELAGTSLVVIGTGRVAHERAGMTPPANAIFTGVIDDGKLRALYEGAICVCLPSRTEGFGLPPVEAMLLGCPAIVAPAGAMPEICRDAATYADVDEPGEWIAAILALKQDLALRARKIADGRARAADFTWRRAGERLLGELLTLANG